MSTTPVLHGDVIVTVTSSVAAELIATAGIEPGDAFRLLPDDSQGTHAQIALTQALVAIANGHRTDAQAGAQTRERRVIGGDVTLTVPAGLAVGLLEHAGLEHSDDGAGWRTRDGREDRNPALALTDSLVAIAEDDLAAEFIEADKEDSR
jgi:hypothetical protein